MNLPHIHLGTNVPMERLFGRANESADPTGKRFLRF